MLMPQNSNIPLSGPPKNKIPPMHPSMYPTSESRRSEPRQLPRPPLYQPRNENDMAEVRIRGKNNFVETRTGSITRTLGQQDENSKLKKELKEGRKRLQVLEQLEQYREEKVRKEMLMLEMQRKQEQERIQKIMEADRKKQAYLEKQKIKVQEFQLKKAEDERQKQIAHKKALE